MNRFTANNQSLNILAVFGTQIILWFIYPWWVAILSLVLAPVSAAVLGLVLMPVASKLAQGRFWGYYTVFAPPVLFATAQIINALTLNGIWG